jgi:hypothetical protein
MAVVAVVIVASVVFGVVAIFFGRGALVPSGDYGSAATGDAETDGNQTKVSEDGESANVTKDDGRLDAGDADARVGIDAYSWEELKSLSQKIAAAGEDEWLDIAKAYDLVDENGMLQGDIKTFSLNDGEATEAKVRIADFRHDELPEGGVAGITFEFANVPLLHRMNEELTNEGGWERSGMREWLNSDFLAMLPEDLRSCVVTVKKQANNAGFIEQVDDTSAVTDTYDRIWLFSVSEVYGSLSSQENVPESPATYDAEGQQYRLYSNQNVTTNNGGFCKKDGAASVWWVRSPGARGSIGFRSVGSDGGWSYDHADHRWGVSPGFCF